MADGCKIVGGYSPGPLYTAGWNGAVTHIAKQLRDMPDCHLTSDLLAAVQALWDAHVKTHAEKPFPQKFGMNYGELVALKKAAEALAARNALQGE